LRNGHRWRLRSPLGETLAASARRHKEKDSCEAELRADMDAHRGTEVLDATVTGESG
jgi:hypothetical protein